MSSDESTPQQRQPRMRTVKRDTTKVRFLELFFDLVFVLAFTQCTALMVEHPTGEGIFQGLFALALLWWAWGGYTWVASVVDPEEGATRFILFGSMAGLMVVALAIPGAFGDQGLTFALAYAVVRYAHLALFVLASRDDPSLRSSVVSLAASSTVGLGILIWASFLDGVPQLMVWALAIVIDFGGPAIFGVAGWKLVPAHFAERYGLIIILALGESIVVIGVGAHGHVTGGVIIAAVFGVLLSSALWWTYFDVVAIVTEHRLTQAAPGREQNSFARDSYTYLHLPMAAGIILVAMGLENTVAHVDEPLKTVPAYALTAGVALYLLAHVGLRLRNAHSISYPRLVVAALLVGATPIATKIPALTTLVATTVVVWAMIAYETKIYGHTRARVRSHH